MVGPNGGDVNVDIAVVVIVADGATEPIHLHRETSLPRHIGERSVSIVVIKRGKRIARFMPRPVHGIDQQNVLPSVIVVIQETNAAAHGLRKILLAERAAVVFEMNACLGSDIRELNGTGGARKFRGRVGCSGLGLRRYWRGNLRRSHRNSFWLARCLWLATRQHKQSNQQQGINDTAQWPLRSRSPFTSRHRATVSFAAFAWRESSQISISMAVGPTTNSA